jgi:hypothetical protein
MVMDDRLNSESPSPVLPGGTVTFLFTDIEGSTRLLQQLGDQYVELLADQRRIGSIGHSGQVLLSETATALVGDDLPEGVSLLDKSGDDRSTSWSDRGGLCVQTLRV